MSGKPTDLADLTKAVIVPENATIIIVVDAPKVSPVADEKPGEILLHFYRALGWNGNDFLDPCKIRTTKEVYDDLYNQIFERFPDAVGVGMHMVNSGPGVESYIPAGKVYLFEGWTKPADPGDEGRGCICSLAINP